MLRRLAFCTLALLAGCATYDAARDERAWIFNTDGEAKLVYGTPQSDDVALMLSCQPRSGQVSVSQGGLRPGDGVTLVSGGRRTTFYGQAEPDQLAGGVFVTANTDVRQPVLAAFAAGGRLAVGGERMPLYATEAERVQIGQFFATCSA